MRKWNPEHPAIEEGCGYDGCPTVGGNATAAESAILNFTDARTDGLQECYAGDLIANILHLCDREGWDIDCVIENGRSHHEAERQPDLD